MTGHFVSEDFSPHGRCWPSRIESLEENLRSLRKHEQDFTSRLGFTYAVLGASEGDYIGCVYFYPPRDENHDVDVRSWVRADRSHLDLPLYKAVQTWLRQSWPWTTPDYARRG